MSSETSQLRQGLVLFVAAYLVVSLSGFTIYLGVAAAMGHSPWAAVDVEDNVAYQRTAAVLPVVNLFVWTVASRVYHAARRAANRTWVLAVVWVAIAVLLDFAVFVVPDHALAVDAAGFYLQQGPWIYLTYAAILIAAFLGAAWQRRRSHQRVTT